MTVKGAQLLDLHDHRPFRRCPECPYVEQARRVTRSRRRWFRVRPAIQGSGVWSGECCPKDGNVLVRECDACKMPLFNPEDDYCRSCGNQYWWRIVTGGVRVDDWNGDHNLISTEGRLRVFCIRQSIANVVADVLVSTDDAWGFMKSRSARALLAEAGQEVETESTSSRHHLGEAWSTRAGRLHAGSLIHVALLDSSGRANPELLVQGLGNSLELADRVGAKTAGYPALGAGSGRLSLEESARLSRRCISEYAAAHEHGSLQQLVFVLFKPEERERFVQAFQDASGGA